MKIESNVVVIIPAFNEENSVKKVIMDISKDYVRDIIVVNNNSNDDTKVNAKEAGAIVIDEPIQGYGNACLKGIDHLKQLNYVPEIIVFIDADYSDYPNELPKVISPIINDGADMVIGSRSLGMKEKGSMTPQQLFGNWLATTLIKLFYKFKYTDLGPFRAIRYTRLLQIEMKDKTYGWTVEMQLKALKKNLKVVEVPVNYRVRIGHSKVSGTLKGTIGAGYKIITTIFKYL